MEETSNELVRDTLISNKPAKTSPTHIEDLFAKFNNDNNQYAEEVVVTIRKIISAILGKTNILPASVIPEEDRENMIADAVLEGLRLWKHVLEPGSTNKQLFNYLNYSLYFYLNRKRKNWFIKQERDNEIIQQTKTVEDIKLSVNFLSDDAKILAEVILDRPCKKQLSQRTFNQIKKDLDWDKRRFNNALEEIKSFIS